MACPPQLQLPICISLAKSPGTECAGQSGWTVLNIFLQQGSETDVAKAAGVGAREGLQVVPPRWSLLLRMRGCSCGMEPHG